jgi:putative addiction module killer protein
MGDGVIGLRVDFGAGWRLYYTHVSQARRDSQIVMLLAGGSKRTQKKDIQWAKALAASLKSQKDSI